MIIFSVTFFSYNYILNFMLNLYGARKVLNENWFYMIKHKGIGINLITSYKEALNLRFKLAYIIDKIYYFMKVFIYT